MQPTVFTDIKCIQVGGCDIITEMHDKGELLPVLEAAVEENEPKSDTE